MKTSIEKIRELSLEEFEKLINYIELDKLTKLLMENALNLPTTSNYYISPKGRKGVFWVGGSFTGKNNKVRAFYTSVIYLNKDVHIEPNFFLEFLDEYSELDEKYKKNSGIYKIYSKLFDIECNIEDNNSPNDVEISTDCLKK